VSLALSLFPRTKATNFTGIKIIWYHGLVIVTNFVFMGVKIGPSNQNIQTDLEDVSKLFAVDNTWKVRITLEK